MMTNPQN